MSSDAYRSYVIRVRRLPGDGQRPEAAMRLEVEDLLGGGTGSVSGEPARTLADSLERMVDTGGGTHTSPDGSPGARDAVAFEGHRQHK